jgi:hypothetical protein
MFSLVLHATARVSRNGRVRGYRNMTIPELVKFTSVDFWTVRWIRTTLAPQPPRDPQAQRENRIGGMSIGSRACLKQGGLLEGCSRACLSDFKTAGVPVASRQLGFNPIDISAAGVCRSVNVDKVRSGATKLDEQLN